MTGTKQTSGVIFPCCIVYLWNSLRQLNSQRFSKELDKVAEGQYISSNAIIMSVSHSRIFGSQRMQFYVCSTFWKRQLLSQTARGRCWAEQTFGHSQGYSLIDKWLFGEALVYPWFFPCLSAGDVFFYSAWDTLHGGAVIHMLLSYCIYTAQKGQKLRESCVYIYYIS